MQYNKAYFLKRFKEGCAQKGILVYSFFTAFVNVIVNDPTVNSDTKIEQLKQLNAALDDYQSEVARSV